MAGLHPPRGVPDAHVLQRIVIYLEFSYDFFRACALRHDLCSTGDSRCVNNQQAPHAIHLGTVGVNVATSRNRWRLCGHTSISILIDLVTTFCTAKLAGMSDLRPSVCMCVHVRVCMSSVTVQFLTPSNFCGSDLSDPLHPPP
jgi:hypothetical protein